MNKDKGQNVSYKLEKDFFFFFKKGSRIWNVKDIPDLLVRSTVDFFISLLRSLGERSGER